MVRDQQEATVALSILIHLNVWIQCPDFWSLVHDCAQLSKNQE